MILYVLGVVIRTFTEAGGVRQIPLWITLAFAGSVLATLFWVSLDKFCAAHANSTHIHMTACI